MTRAEACLVLNMVDHIGPITVRRLSDRFGNPEAILETPERELRTVNGVGREMARAISRWREEIPWEKELEHARAQGLRLICAEDEEYPALLRQIHDPPLVLYVRGRLEDGEKNSLAIVGARHPSHYGQETARRFGFQFANIGMTVVSGLAVGIDSAAHRGCLQAKGRTVAVLGFGFDYLPKADHAKLGEEIVAGGGALVSEFPMGKKPDRQTFPMRNRIASGMSLGTLVVEAGATSGALITANFASEQGRQVFAVPGRIDQPNAIGSHKLIQTGAKLVQCVEDVLEEFEMLLPRGLDRAKGEADAAAPRAAVKLTETERLVFEAVGREETPMDAILSGGALPPSVISATLMVLEMKRLVRQLPGKLYVRLADLA
ncbi:MAG: DNA-protecting protein DprA [Verrucomicrobiae bacterium]|nr:DNA-protecting protein DprA [Verrucomicrobiae bacterium]